MPTYPVHEMTVDGAPIVHKAETVAEAHRWAKQEAERRIQLSLDRLAAVRDQDYQRAETLGISFADNPGHALGDLMEISTRGRDYPVQSEVIERWNDNFLNQNHLIPPFQKYEGWGRADGSISRDFKASWGYPDKTGSEHRWVWKRGNYGELGPFPDTRRVGAARSAAGERRKDNRHVKWIDDKLAEGTHGAFDDILNRYISDSSDDELNEDEYAKLNAKIRLEAADINDLLAGENENRPRLGELIRGVVADRRQPWRRRPGDERRPDTRRVGAARSAARRRAGPGLTRQFGGEQFKYARSYPHQNDARWAAMIIRAQALSEGRQQNARVIPVKGGWAIYTRRRS